MKDIILASQSPRRKELMELLNVDFKVIVSNIEEYIDKDLPLDEALIILASQKAKSVFKDHQDSLVIGSDSIVYQDNIILNKPKDKEDAFNMIKSYSNNHHSVMTAVSIMDKNKAVNFVSKCNVYFDNISDDEILQYLKNDEYKDKAGAYAIQGLMAKFINKVEGDFYSVVGFPVSKVYKTLKEDFNVFD